MLSLYRLRSFYSAPALFLWPFINKKKGHKNKETNKDARSDARVQ